MNASQTNLNPSELRLETVPEASTGSAAPKGVTAMLLAGLLLFAGLMIAYLVIRTDVRFSMPALPWIFWGSTGVLVLTSVALQYAMKSLWFFDGVRSFRAVLAATGLAYFFVGVQSGGLVMLSQIRTPFETISPTLFWLTFAMVALNIVQVAGGAAALSWASLKSEKHHYEGHDIARLRPLAVYFHVATIAWLLAFAMLWIVNR
jgi:cytochrome c oxidase subunit III